jgi:hypothetical protein
VDDTNNSLVIRTPVPGYNAGSFTGSRGDRWKDESRTR